MLVFVKRIPIIFSFFNFFSLFPIEGLKLRVVGIHRRELNNFSYCSPHHEMVR